ncbi:acyl carrier protein [Actinomadura rupiterrae]|uniref:acyl carrier protein n=1 Tax=Actinomadura rupiterrae TaxID=559627 RepID=UPI0020A351E4|nr:acyl carrier protein [Actinomadura rupiterrae]MCP2341101.1 acyl carrier protein [Actinomadura rupiterrae]
MTLSAERLDRTRIEDCLSEAVAREVDLPHEELDPEATFEELGLDSLGAVTVAKRVAAELRIKVPAVLLFNFPTVQALSEHLAAEQAA